MSKRLASRVLMLYCTVNTVAKFALGASYNYILDRSNNQLDCPGGLLDTCTFSCDGEYDKRVSCGNVGVCLFTIEMDCGMITINGTNAQHLQVILNEGAFILYAEIYCPVDSDYIGPEKAPCIIDMTGDLSRLRDSNIYTKHGIPRDVWIKEGSHPIMYSMPNTILHCDAGSTGADNYFSKSNPCWETDSPTVDPTESPTKPTAEPTREPSLDPTVEPTSKPTVEPTLNPTLFEATATYLTAFAPEAARNTVPVQLLLVISLIVCTFIVAVQCFLFKKRTHPKNNQKTASNPKEYQSLWTWLTRKVKLPEYYGNFVDNGYQNMLSILDLKHESQLSEIGIHNVEHRMRILSNIEELRKIAYHEMENKLLHIQSMNPQTSEELPPLPRSLSASPNIFQLDGEIRGENYHRMMTNIEAFIQNLDGEDSFEDHETHGQTKGSESVDGVNVIYAEDDEPGKASESDSLDEIYVKGEASLSEDKECVVKDEEEYDVNGAMHMITTKDKEESIHSKQSQVIKYWEYETSR